MARRSILSLLFRQSAGYVLFFNRFSFSDTECKSQFRSCRHWFFLVVQQKWWAERTESGVFKSCQFLKKRKSRRKILGGSRIELRIVGGTLRWKKIFGIFWRLRCVTDFCLFCVQTVLWHQLGDEIVLKIYLPVLLPFFMFFKENWLN